MTRSVTKSALVRLNRHAPELEGGRVGKWAPYSRRELRRRRSEWFRRNARTVTFVVLGVLVAACVATWSFSTLLSGELQWYALGAVHVALVAGALHALNSLFLAFDREAPGMSAVRGVRTTPGASCWEPSGAG